MTSRSGEAPKIVIISAVHDYRMARRGSIQAVADAFLRAGFETTFLSVRFSALSLMKRDPRVFLRRRANRFETSNGIQCYLWWTPFHPFKTQSAAFDVAMRPLHDVYAAWPNGDVDRLFREAHVVMVESGLGVLLIPRIRNANPHAAIIYRGADALDTIGAHPLLQERLERDAACVDRFCLLARGMASQFGFASERTFVVPQGIHRPDFEQIGASPYGPGRNAICVGSMLFDASFFEAAAPAFPDVTFHVIGCGSEYKGGKNVHVYPEMPFEETLPFVAHADIGIAPYRDAPMAHYLSESSLKLTQFSYLRIPAVCPHFAVGERPHRFGYTPGDAAEIVSAIGAALADTFDAIEPKPPTWDEIVPRLLEPERFPDTAISSRYFASGGEGGLGCVNHGANGGAHERPSGAEIKGRPKQHEDDETLPGREIRDRIDLSKHGQDAQHG